MASVAETPPSHRKRWEEANPFVSGLLAYLIPGAGHLYQGRIFKGLIYLVCIHGAFFTGMCLGEGMTVHHKVPPNAQGWRKISLSYAAQFGAGAWALPAIVQARRVEEKDNRVAHSLTKSLTASFQGMLEADGPGNAGFDGPLVGTIALEPTADGGVEGTFKGTLNGKPVELDLASGFYLDRPIGATPGRELKMRVERKPNDHPNLDLRLVGTIPRPIQDWYEVPPETPVLQEITGRLGKYFELALVFTWIAGLLNVLAIWDCVKGPSLGFGDEPSPTRPDGEPALPVAAAPAAVPAVSAIASAGLTDQAQAKGK